ncbi:MAG: O-antigen polysaccharide polymerase Wzy family protein [Bacteroidales bacterium]|nr:O-antigen polysaccharide polymerase Wzy family protein [Bacteroidales bacterium]
MTFSLPKNIALIYVIVNTSITLLAIFQESNPLYIMCLLVWSNMMIYALRKIKDRILLFCFGIAFFVFLLGRDGMEQLFNHEVVTPFSADIDNHSFFAILISLLGIWITYAIFKKSNDDCGIPNHLSSKNALFYFYIRKYSKISFFFVYPFAILINVVIAFYVIRFGYQSSFTDLKEMIDNSPTFYMLSKIELLLPTAFSLFMSSLPSKDEFKPVGKAYLIYLIITLACGARGDFVLGALLMIIFMVFMQRIQPEIVWVKKRQVRICIFCLPFIAIGATFYKNIRFGESVEDMSMFQGFSDFFYDQGVSNNVIKRAYQYEEDIPKQSGFYSFEFLYSGIPARLSGNKVYQGNTVDHATKGHSFTHAFGYTLMGTGYLAGRGPGSSYIAELYYDFGYIGVFLGSCFYGFIFTLINNFKTGGIFRRSLVFMAIPRMLWSPRSSFSGFISFLIAPTTIGLLLIVFTLAQLSYVRHRKNYKTVVLS